VASTCDLGAGYRGRARRQRREAAPAQSQSIFLTTIRAGQHRGNAGRDEIPPAKRYRLAAFRARADGQWHTLDLLGPTVGREGLQTPRGTRWETRVAGARVATRPACLRARQRSRRRRVAACALMLPGARDGGDFPRRRQVRRGPLPARAPEECQGADSPEGAATP
jgi:hypothetical protein